MATIRRQSAAKFRLTPSILRLLLCFLILIHVIVLWRATGNQGGSQEKDEVENPSATNTKDDPERTELRGNDDPVVIPFVVSMTGCGEDPFMEGVSWS